MVGECTGAVAKSCLLMLEIECDEDDDEHDYVGDTNNMEQQHKQQQQQQLQHPHQRKHNSTTSCSNIINERLDKISDSSYILAAGTTPATVIKYNTTKTWLTGIALLLAGALLLPPYRAHTHERDINVAFIGNSITFVNDLPRFMETLSRGHIHQNSCLHGAAKFHSILRTGNGMAHKWTTNRSSVESDFLGYEVYDFGACTVEQLLIGYDNNLSEYNANGYYVDDGKNPCFNDPVYLQYTNEQYLLNPEPPHWDYIVLNDQTKYPVHSRQRSNSIRALRNVYVPYLLETGATPVLLVTHGYWSNYTSMTGLGGDVPTFTSRVYYGYQQYESLLKDLLPSHQHPIMAPVGLAYLLIWEENFQMWEKLFFVDGFHPSPHGTFLMAHVLYAALYRRMPSKEMLPQNISELWYNARKMAIKGSYKMPFPTHDEAVYLRHVAQRITLRGHRPKSLIYYQEEFQEYAENIEEDEIEMEYHDDDDAYQERQQKQQQQQVDDNYYKQGDDYYHASESEDNDNDNDDNPN